MRTRIVRITALVGLTALGVLAVLSLGSDVWEFYVSLLIVGSAVVAWFFWRTRPEPPSH